MSEKDSLSSKTLERADTLNGSYEEKDVFGHEEEHDVRNDLSALMLNVPSNIRLRSCVVDLKLLADLFPFGRLYTRRYHGSSLPPL